MAKIGSCADGKQVALREFLVFDDEIRDRLLKFDPSEVTAATRAIVVERQQTLLHDAKKHYEMGVHGSSI